MIGLTDKRELLERSGFDGVTAADIAPAAAGLFRGASEERGVTASQIEFQSEAAPRLPPLRLAASPLVRSGLANQSLGRAAIRQSRRRFNGSKRERRGSAPCRIGGFRLRRVRVKPFRVGALLWPLV